MSRLAGQAYRQGMTIDYLPWKRPAGLAGRVCLRDADVELTYAEVARRVEAVGELNASPSGTLPVPDTRPDDLALLIYTSGSAGDIHPLYSYAHVPHGYDGDATAAIIAQIERFAPGFRDRIVAQASYGPASFAAANPNFTGGDIITGAKDARQLVLGPRATLSPYDLGVPGMYLCSAATPPDPGVHGMCGANAARQALRYLRRRGAA